MSSSSLSNDRHEVAAASTCSAETAGYDGMFGVYCSLPEGHEGPHNDGYVEWDFVDPEWRNSDNPVAQMPEEKKP